MPVATTPPAVNPEKLNAFLGKVVGDFGAALSSTLVYIGQVLGLYKAMADSQPITPEELARRTKTHVRYVREWLINQAAGGYVEFDPASGHYHLSPEQVAALTDEDSPAFVGGGFYVIKAMGQAQARIIEAFRTGGGLLWKDNDPDLFIGTERFFRPGYKAHLVAEWIPALEGVDAAMRQGTAVADVGCGHGASTILMAHAFPKCRFYGFDNHEPSIQHAQKAAAAAGVGDRITFMVSEAGKIPNHQYGLVAFFDCLHDMGDPEGALRRARETLAPGGKVMLVEPMAGERVEENFNPIGRIFSAASTLCCTANSMALKGLALGTVVSDFSLRELARDAGLGHFRRATQTPFNRIFELKA